MSEDADEGDRDGADADTPVGGGDTGGSGDPIRDPSDTEAHGGDATDADADPFADLAVADVDDEALWADLEDGDGGEVDGDLFERLADENPTHAAAREVRTDGETAVVPKSKFCQRCEYFADPPEVRCTNPGTTISEVVDSDRFEVRNCPVVAERLGTSDVLDVD